MSPIKKINKYLLLILSLFLLNIRVQAQDDLMKLAMQGDSLKNKDEKVIATFKNTRIISAHSIETVKAHTLDFRVAHRFGPVGNSQGGDYHNFFGFDASSDIRIAFEYGINDKLTIGYSRVKKNENYEGHLKYRLLQQTMNNHIPVSISLFANSTITAERDPDSSYKNFAHRMTYVFEALIARKFSGAFSFQLMPVLLHRNFVAAWDQNDLFALGAGGRLKFSKRTALICDYYYPFSKARNAANSGFYHPLGLGVEIETGGHVFSIMFTNSAGILENDYLANTNSSWLKGGFRFSFNISRGFVLY